MTGSRPSVQVELDRRWHHRGGAACAPRPVTCGCPGWSCRDSPTSTRTRSTARCAAAPTTTAGRSGPGASGCTPSPSGSTRSPTAAGTAAYAEMALAGITAVGEFHYLHHGPGGCRTTTRTPWGGARPGGARGRVRLTLLDTLLPGGRPGGGRVPAGRPGAATVLGRIGRGVVEADRAARRPRRDDRRSTGGAPSTRCGPSGPRTSRGCSARPARCTCTSPSSLRRTRPASPSHGITPTGLLADHGAARAGDDRRARRRT